MEKITVIIERVSPGTTRPLAGNEEYGVQNGPKLFKDQMNGAIDYTLHNIRHTLCPSKLSFTHP